MSQDNKWWKKTNEKKNMIADCKPPTTTRKSYLSPSLLSLPRRTHSNHNLRYRSHQHPGTITFCFMCRELSRTCMLHPSVDEEVRARKVLIRRSELNNTRPLNKGTFFVFLSHPIARKHHVVQQPPLGSVPASQWFHLTFGPVDRRGRSAFLGNGAHDLPPPNGSSHGHKGNDKIGNALGRLTGGNGGGSSKYHGKRTSSSSLASSSSSDWPVWA